jgi:hypothetical protein
MISCGCFASGIVLGSLISNTFGAYSNRQLCYVWRALFSAIFLLGGRTLSGEPQPYIGGVGSSPLCPAKVFLFFFKVAYSVCCFDVHFALKAVV